MNNKKLKTFFITVITCFIFISASPVKAELFSKGFEYTYSLSKNDFTVAYVNRKLDIALDKITFTSYAYPVGFASLFISETITEQSVINNTGDKLKPQSFSYVKKADQIKEQFHIKFDWQNNIATDSRVKAPFKLSGESYDSLSFQLALAQALSQATPDLNFTLIDNKHLKTYNLENQGEEQLETEAGTFTTVKITYFDEVKKRNVTIWCARQLDFLPVQITRVDEDGDYGTLKLLSLKSHSDTEPYENGNDF